MDIYERIKLLRKILLLSQTAFAEKLGMTMQGVQKWEAKKVEIKESSLMLLENIYNVNPSWLRTGVGEMFNSAEGSVSAGSSRALTLHEETIIKYYNELTEADKNEIFGYLQKAAEAKRIKRNFSDRIKKEKAG